MDSNIPLTLDDYANRVRDILDELKICHCVVVGHSFGGRVGIRLCGDDRVSALALLSPAGMRPRRGLKYYMKIIRYKTFKKLGKDVSGMGSEDWRQLTEAQKRTFVNIVNTYQEKEARKIRKPVLLLWGGEDKSTPVYMAKRLYRLIKESTLYVYPNCDHFFYLKQTRDVCKRIYDFLEEYEVCGDIIWN